jgi:hypothetical protein
VKIGIHTLHVCQCDFLPQYHFVESPDKESIKEATMENGQPHYSANKLKVVQVLWVYPRVGVDLQRIIVMCRVFKETIKWIEHLVRKKEEKLPVFQLEGGREKARCCNHLERPP